MYRKVLPTTFYKVIENRPGYIGTVKVVGKINQSTSASTGSLNSFTTAHGRIGQAHGVKGSKKQLMNGTKFGASKLPAA